MPLGTAYPFPHHLPEVCIENLPTWCGMMARKPHTRETLGCENLILVPSFASSAWERPRVAASPISCRVRRVAWNDECGMMPLQFARRSSATPPKVCLASGDSIRDHVQPVSGKHVLSSAAFDVPCRYLTAFPSGAWERGGNRRRGRGSCPSTGWMLRTLQPSGCC